MKKQREPLARRLIIAVTGASGAIYATRLLAACLDLGLRIDLIISEFGKRLLLEECALDLKTESIREWLDRRYGTSGSPGQLELHDPLDLGAGIASGSQHRDGMAVVPCSMRTLAGISQGLSSNLIERAADVTLKESRPLILVPRETPLSLIQLENMSRAARAGATLLPAMPAFYHKPQSIDDLAGFIAGRILSLLGFEHDLFPPWEG